MATTSDMAAGRLVYKPFEPNNPGIVLSNAPSRSPSHRAVEVMWLDGATTREVVMPYALNDFDALVEDHRRKLARHEGSRARLIEMNGREEG